MNGNSMNQFPDLTSQFTKLNLGQGTPSPTNMSFRAALQKGSDQKVENEVEKDKAVFQSSIFDLNETATDLQEIEKNI